MQTSASNDLISSRASGVFHDAGWWTGRPFSSAKSASGSSGLPSFVGRATDGDDVLAALQQPLKHRLAEGLLAVNHYSHALFPFVALSGARHPLRAHGAPARFLFCRDRA